MKTKGSWLVGLLSLYLVPQVVTNDYWLHTLDMTLIFIIAATGLNLISGFTGQLSLGHGALFGIGAYATSLISVKLGVSFWISVPLAAIIAALFGIIIGIPSLKLEGPYLALTTIGFGQIIEIILNEWQDLTGGPMGFQGIPYPSLGSRTLTTAGDQYYILLTITIVAIWLIKNLIDSKTGRAFRAVKGDNRAAGVMGINTVYYKLLAFVISAGLAGLAGALYAHRAGYVSPDTFNFGLSLQLLLMVVLGGMGSLAGAIVGAAFLELAFVLLRGVEEYQMIFYAVAIILSSMFMPRGLVGLAQALAGRVMSGRKAAVG